MPRCGASCPKNEENLEAEPTVRPVYGTQGNGVPPIRPIHPKKLAKSLPKRSTCLFKLVDLFFH